MRKPRDYDAELKALNEKAKELKARKVQQLGELVISTGADNLAIEELAGALIEIAEITNTEQGEAKRKERARRGTALFRGRSKRTSNATGANPESHQPQPGSNQSPSGRESET